MPPNRIAVVVAAAITLALAALPVVADMDWTSTAGIVAGIVAVLGIVQKWLDGWQKHEDRIARPAATPVALVSPNAGATGTVSTGYVHATAAGWIPSAVDIDDEKLEADEAPPEADEFVIADPAQIPADVGDRNV